MSNKDKATDIDNVLDLLSKPLSRYILSVLAGVNPGSFTETSQDSESFIQDDNDLGP